MPTVVDAIFSFNPVTEQLVPLFTSPVQAGFPSPADDYSEQSLDFNEFLVANPAATFVVRAKGDSMVDAGIESGDHLVVDKSVEAEDGDIVIAEVDGQFMVKRYRNQNGRLRLVTENPQHRPVELREGNEVTIWGVVKHVIHTPGKHGRRHHTR